MNTKATYIILLLLIIVSVGVSFYAYPRLPDQVATHWNASGAVNGTMSKTVGVFLLPAVLIVLALGFMLIPRIDPLRENISMFRNRYNLLVTAIVVCLLYFEFLMLAWNLGNRFDMGRWIAPALGLLFIILGLVMRRIKRNYFVGIRTPWTLASDRVWEKTHKHGAVVFIVSGAVACLGVAAPGAVWFYFLGVVILGSVWLFLYSYLLFRQEIQGGKNAR